MPKITTIFVWTKHSRRAQEVVSKRVVVYTPEEALEIGQDVVDAYMQGARDALRETGHVSKADVASIRPPIR
jgi:hypothetical protein